MKKICEKIDDFLEWGGVKKNVVLLAVSAAALVLSLTKALPGLPFDPAWVAVVLCGIPIVCEAFIGLVTEFNIKADVLVAMALIASVCIGEIFAAGEVAFIMQLGELLEDLTVERSRAGIERLVKLTPVTARVKREGKESVIPASEVIPGDVLSVLPGETIPVDGAIIEGETSIDQALLTGESIPVDKTVGDMVFSGTVNRFGAFRMQAEKTGEDSSVQRMIRLAQSADAGKTKIVGAADKWATWIVCVALAAALGTWIVTGEILRAVTILVVFCPCSLVLATPTAVIAAMGNATGKGFLVREGDAMERLARVDTVTFDKTGTLTTGKPEVLAFQAVKGTPAGEFARLLASAEKRSEHPIGKAIAAACEGSDVPEPEAFQMLPGLGVSALVEGKRILAGNPRLLKENGVDIPEPGAEWLSRGCSLVYTAVNGSYAGFAAVSDTMREGANETVHALQRIGVKPVLLTGDHPNAAQAIAERTGITKVYAGCLPEEKLERIRHLQEKGKQVCMVGDGINDAPALKTADVGIAMGGIGSDIAVEAADAVLVKDDVSALPHVFALSRKMMKTIRFNLIFSMGLNFLAIVLAMTGILNPVVGALVHNCGSVFVIGNSALLLAWKRKE